MDVSVNFDNQISLTNQAALTGDHLYLLPIFWTARPSFFRVLHTIIFCFCLLNNGLCPAAENDPSIPYLKKKKGVANYCTKTLTVVIALEKTPTPWACEQIGEYESHARSSCAVGIMAEMIWQTKEVEQEHKIRPPKSRVGCVISFGLLEFICFFWRRQRRPYCPPSFLAVSANIRCFRC